MARVVISGLITVLQQPGLMSGLEEEHQQLLQHFTAILPVIPDDELLGAEREEQEEVKTWLRDLNTAAYKADDIVDEFEYAMLQAEAEADRYQRGDKVRTNTFSLCKLISRKRLPFEGGMREKLTEIVIRMGDLVERWSRMSVISRQGQELIPCAEGWQDPALSTLKEIDPIIVGRDKEKEIAVSKLLGSPMYTKDTITSVIIIGASGIGKTTLARFICGDARIKNNYEIIIRVDVVYESSIAGITKSVIDQIIGKDCCLSEDDMDLLVRRINQELSGKRCLLVLDGLQKLWGETWHQFKSWIEQSAADGSSLLVTSHDEEERRRIQMTVRPRIRTGDKPRNRRIVMHIDERIIDLLPLGNADLWTLFCRRAFIADKEICPEMLKISKQIVERCHGSPLEVSLVGGLMRFKKEHAEWQEVLQQMEQYPQNNLILNSVLLGYHIFVGITMMCYDYLSSEMKVCFAFCSHFREGQYIDQEVLVKLWMANGLISVEEKGNRIFNELALRHFFEDVKLVPESSPIDKHGYRSRVICKMHPVLHHLAIYVSRNEYGVIPISSNIPRDDGYLPQIRRLSILGDSPLDIPVLLKNYPHVRTLIFPDDLFIRTVNCGVLPIPNSLRALHLHSALFDRDLFELKYTKHLRYLDLSGSRIKRLPEYTSSLYSLQTLNISKCLLLCWLPEDMRYMRSLRHLYAHKCPKLKKMPVHLGQLSCLRTLTTYIVGENVGNNIDEIKSLDLYGLLEIYNLCKVKKAAIAKEANLFLKTNLKRLTLCWGKQQLVMSKEHNNLEILESLQPHNGLKVLKIQQYGGHEFANWLAYPISLPNLVELHLIGCSQCSTIPAVWKLRSLQVFYLKHMINLTCMSSFTSFPDIDEKDSSELFPSLQKLVLVGLKRLERWQEGEVLMQRPILSFPMLDEMEITNCPKLKTMPSVPVLKYLTISIENHGLLQSAVDLITQSNSLVEVNMEKASGSDNEVLSALGVEVDKHNSHKLRVMRLDSTNSFFMERVIPHLRLEFWRSLVSLEKLDIFNCSSIVDWPLEEFRNLCKLKRLSMRKCQNLTGSLPKPLREGEKLLPLLQFLEFYECPSLKEVPNCSSIVYLELDECPEINSISGLNNLTMLFLSCLSWRSLPTGFGELKKLESLRVFGCYTLTCLPVELAGLTSLRTLIINTCPRVMSLPKGLDQMLSGLEKFQISECPDLEKFYKEGPYSSIISQIGQTRNNTAGSSPDASSSSLSLALGAFGIS